MFLNQTIDFRNLKSDYDKDKITWLIEQINKYTEAKKKFKHRETDDRLQTQRKYKT